MNQSSKKTFKIASLSIFFVIVIAYAIFRSSNLILGVKIKNVNIVDGAKVTESILAVKGNAKNAINLTLNGQIIFIDKMGNFNETIALLPGYNIVEIEARDKFDNVDRKDYKLIY